MLKIGEITSLRIGVPPPDVRVIRFEQTEKSPARKARKNKSPELFSGRKETDMHRFHKVVGSSQILMKKLGNFGDGFVCRRCQEWISWRPDKDAIMAKRKGFRKCTYRKLLVVLDKLKKPLYCDKCMTNMFNKRSVR